VNSIAAGPDGSLWFAEEDKAKIGRMTTAGEAVEFDLPSSNQSPRGIAKGPDGNVWFTEISGNIGRITPAGTITEFPIPSGTGARAIVAGTDGNLWFTEFGPAGGLGTCTMSGEITERALPRVADDTEITVGPDGNVWFIEGGIAQPEVAQVTPAGIVTEFPVPTIDSNPQGIAAGWDGNIWFAEGGKIGRMTTAGANTVEFSVAVGSYQLTKGPDGNVWFTGGTGSDPSVGSIAPDGTVTTYTVSSVPRGITTGSDGNIWFTEAISQRGTQIGRFLIP
jgi:streptogramin lyase